MKKSPGVDIFTHWVKIVFNVFQIPIKIFCVDIWETGCSKSFLWFWLIDCHCFISNSVCSSRNCCFLMWYCMPDIGYIQIKFRSFLEFLAIALMLSGEFFFGFWGVISVGYGMGRKYFSGFSYTTFWIYSDSRQMAVCQIYVRLESISLNLQNELDFYKSLWFADNLL